MSRELKLLSTDLKWLNFEHACGLSTVLCVDRYIIVKVERKKNLLVKLRKTNP